jgi:hypothetical protein
MRKTVVGLVAALALAAGGAAAGTASADPGPSNQCYGQIIAGISSTWPWAHNGQTDFAPPPGAVALWLQIFGPGLGVSSVRDLQLLFCSA